MSERDTFHKEMEKIQDEVQNSKRIMIWFLWYKQ